MQTREVFSFFPLMPFHNRSGNWDALSYPNKHFTILESSFGISGQLKNLRSTDLEALKLRNDCWSCSQDYCRRTGFK